MDEQGKVIISSLHAGGSIGLHRHETSDDINQVLSGKGKAVCDGKEEYLSAGMCHICKKGSEHSIMNIGDEDLVLLTVVTERQNNVVIIKENIRNGLLTEIGCF